MNKKLLCVLLIIITTIIIVCPCYAHSGGTDSNGGHYNQSTGEYHYHHGYPEHQHPDGVCPYKVTNKSSSGSYTSNNSSITEIIPTTFTSETVTSTNSTSQTTTKHVDNTPDWELIIYILIAAGGLTYFFYLFCGNVDRKVKSYQRRNK